MSRASKERERRERARQYKAGVKPYDLIRLGVAADAVAQECSLGCVPTYGYDYSRDNVNPNETYFKATTLGTKLIPSWKNSPDLNGIVYAQPL